MPSTRNAQSLQEMIYTLTAPSPDGKPDGKHGTHNDHRGLPGAWLCTWGRHPGGKLYHALFSQHCLHPVPQLMNVHKAACASSQDTQALSCTPYDGRTPRMINAGSPGGSTHECGFSRLECPAMKEACCMSERAGSRVGKQLEDRSVGRCATTTESEGAANPWER